jgi:TRAP-type C4-dicarboxylate transport system permease large subunit
MPYTLMIIAAGVLVIMVPSLATWLPSLGK